jgi:mono/diheme cytochrome c family protein
VPPAAAPSPAAPERPAAAPAPSPPAPAAAATAATASTGPGDAARGKALYAQYCASCHGATGNADGPLGQALNPRPARHSDGAYMRTLSDEHLFKVIQQGGAAVGKSPLMAPWGGTLSDAQIRDVVAFVRTLAN